MEETKVGAALTEMEIDAIGEVMNISMGSAATAVSSMLDTTTVITTPSVQVTRLIDVDYRRLEPAIMVKITYTEGLTGSNVMVFRQRDLQLILNCLMGVDAPPAEDFVFDELSISAACEVMNQMMGASATAMSDFFGISVNISTPTAAVMENDDVFRENVGADPEQDVVMITFNISIKDMINSEFVSVMTADFAKKVVKRFIAANEAAQQAAEQAEAAAEEAAQPQEQAEEAAPAAEVQQPAQTPAQPAPQPMQQPVQMAPTPPMGAQIPTMGQMPTMGGMANTVVQNSPMAPQIPMGAAGAQYPNYGMYGQEGYGTMQSHVIKNVQFPEFPQNSRAMDTPVMGNNMDLIMNVPLEVSIEIGSTKRRIKDIMDFAQGTVIELDKQAGAPVDIIVNGQLIAHGDVVVIDDNFGVRITEIVGTKELMSALSSENK